MSMQKAQKGLSSSSSISSLSDIELRSRTVSRDSVLCFSEDNEFCERDSLNNVSQTKTLKNLGCKNKKNRLRTETLRKLKKTKKSISKKSKWKLQETIVLAPFYALKESFQNQLKEICGKTNLSKDFTNKRNNNTVNNVVEVESLVPIFRQDLFSSNRNNLKRKRCLISQKESNYCDCLDNSSNSQSESCINIHHENQGKNDLRTDSDSSSVILEREGFNKRSDKCNEKSGCDLSDELEFISPTTSAAKKSKPSHPQKKRKAKENRFNSEQESKLPSQTKNRSTKKKISYNAKIPKKASARISQPRYRTRSVTKRENERRNRLLKMMQTQNEIITKFDELKPPISSKNEPCKEKNNCTNPIDDAVRRGNNTLENTEPTQGISEEPPCVILHPYDPSKGKTERNLSDYSSDESVQEATNKELEKRKFSSDPNSGIQSEKNSPEEEKISNENDKKNEDHHQSEKTLEDTNKNLTQKSVNSNKGQFFKLGIESASENVNKERDFASEAEGITKNDLVLNCNDIAAETVEPSVTVQEHYNEPSSVESSYSEEHEETEPANLDSLNHMEMPSFCCSVQESDQQNDLSTAGYIFGPRNDFSRLRESCEFSFGLSQAIPDDQQSDTGDYFEL